MVLCATIFNLLLFRIVDVSEMLVCICVLQKSEPEFYSYIFEIKLKALPQKNYLNFQSRIFFFFNFIVNVNSVIFKLPILGLQSKSC